MRANHLNKASPKVLPPNWQTSLAKQAHSRRAANVVCAAIEHKIPGSTAALLHHLRNFHEQLVWVKAAPAVTPARFEFKGLKSQSKAC